VNRQGHAAIASSTTRSLSGLETADKNNAGEIKPPLRFDGVFSTRTDL
jgi:hypothetical protein